MQTYTGDTGTAPTPNNVVGLVFPDWDSAISGGAAVVYVGARSSE